MKPVSLLKRMRDSELVKRALKGDQFAYEELFNRYCSYVFKLALPYVEYRNDDANDITQKAFIQAFSKLDSLNDQDKFSPWLISITRHTALNHIRKTKSLSEVPLAPGVLIDSFFYSQPDDGEGQIETEKEMIRKIIEDIEDDALRETVSLYYIEGENSAQIAKKQGVAQSTVTSRLKRFRTVHRKLIMGRILDLRGIE